MKLLFDQNLSPALRDGLQELYPGSIHVTDVGLDQTPDTTIWQYAKENGFAVVSKDSDYRRLSYERGQPPKLIRIRTGNASAALVESLLRDNYGEIEAFGQDPALGIIELR